MNVRTHSPTQIFQARVGLLILLGLFAAPQLLVAQQPSPFVPPVPIQDPQFLRPVPVLGSAIPPPIARRPSRRQGFFPSESRRGPAYFPYVPETSFYGPTTSPVAPGPVGPAIGTGMSVPAFGLPGGTAIPLEPEILNWDFSGLKSLNPGNPTAEESAHDYNFHVVVSEKFANRVIAKPRTDEGAVRDFVLGADVFGVQRTDSQVRVDFHGSEGSIRFEALLDGNTNSSTVGVTPQASVNSVGSYLFRAVKPIRFDGRQFTTQKPQLYVHVQNQVVGAQTNLTGVPVIGQVADRIAVRAARNRQPESDQIARQRVAERVLPQFNRELDKALHEANTALKEQLPRLETAGLIPLKERYGSSETHGTYSSLLMNDGEFGGTPLPVPERSEQSGLVVCIHESLMNNMFARLRLEGTAMTDHQLAALVRQFQALLMGQSLDDATPAEPPETEPSYIVLDNHQPIRVEIVDDRMIFYVRAGFEPAGQDVIPTQLITIPVGMELLEKSLVISSDPVSVTDPGPSPTDVILEPPVLEPGLGAPAGLPAPEPVPQLQFEPPVILDDSLEEADFQPSDETPKDHPIESAEPTFLDRFVQAVRAGILKKKVESTLPPIEMSRRMDFPLQGLETFSMRVASVRAKEGWLIITFE